MKLYKLTKKPFWKIMNINQPWKARKGSRELSDKSVKISAASKPRCGDFKSTCSLHFEVVSESKKVMLQQWSKLSLTMIHTKEKSIVNGLAKWADFLTKVVWSDDATLTTLKLNSTINHHNCTYWRPSSCFTVTYQCELWC